MAEVDRTYLADGDDNVLHYRVVHCGTTSAATSSCSEDDVHTVVATPEIAHRLQRQADSEAGRRRHLQVGDQPRGSECRDCVTPVIDSVHTGDSHTTYQLSLATGAQVANMYTIFGDGAYVMRLPPSQQVSAPFGVDIGGVHPAIVESNAASAYDSWLTVGLSTGNAGNEVSSIGIDFSSWNDATELRVSNGAVFWMSPDNGPRVSSVLVAQITVASGEEWHATVSAQGRSTNSGEDWSATGIEFRSRSYIADQVAVIAQQVGAECLGCISSSLNVFQECVAETAMPTRPEIGLERICSEQDEELVRFEPDSTQVVDAGPPVSLSCLSCIAWELRDGISSDHNEAVSACAVDPPPPPPVVCTGFDCANSVNDIATDPGSISCDGETCTLAECCTVLPPQNPDDEALPGAVDPPPPPPAVCTDFDCADADYNIATDPDSITCGGEMCNAVECCTDPPACEGGTYGSNGVAPCSECATPSVVNSAHTECTACSPGYGPNPDRTSCVACPSGEFSASGECEVCPSHMLVSQDRTECNPRTCADANGDGLAVDNFDCASSQNSLSATPVEVQCRTNPCTTLECCTVAPPPPRTCADPNADGFMDDTFDCISDQNDLTSDPERTACPSSGCTATQCCTLVPLARAPSLGCSVEVLVDTSTTMSVEGYVTLRLLYTLSSEQRNVYAMSGTADGSMQFPAAYQVTTPFGVDVGGVPPAFFPFEDSEFDSWLTVGLTEGNSGELALSPGFGIDTWTADSSFETDNGSVFWMSPDSGPTVVRACITCLVAVLCSTSCTACAAGIRVYDLWQRLLMCACACVLE
jgi:hypothetical protein